MIQGTASDVGKSIVVTAICRILSNDGYRVAPFKAQNMALNSTVTKDGKEIGRAQGVQAEAARTEPKVEMNPILLKPVSDNAAQVVVEGKPIGNMSAEEYFAKKSEFLSIVESSINKLKEDYDFIVIEGAGSPAEINLKHRDIVNMETARMAKSPVLLVADIDRGGMFASIIGTLELLDPSEVALVKGLIVNKFRGQESLLKPGLDYIYDRTKIPVLGVIPFINGLEIEAEDSFCIDKAVDSRKEGAILEVAVVKLPHISNFTDIDALKREADVNVRFIKSGGELQSADLLIIPGTKSTIKSLYFLRETGLDKEIINFAESGGMVIGICGGFQLLGRRLDDRGAVETDHQEARGLGLLPVDTEFTANKITRQSKVSISGGGPMFEAIKDEVIEGYEIRNGVTVSSDEAPFSRNVDDGSADGAVSLGGNVVGTYLHGIFDNDRFRRKLLDKLFSLKSRDRARSVDDISNEAFKDSEYERLASIVGERLDMKIVYDLLQIDKAKV